VLGGLIQEFVLREPALGIPELAAFVVAGMAGARLLGPRLGNGWPIIALGLIVAAAVTGGLLAPAARAALGEGLGPALAAHPGGWVAGLAVLRGFAHAQLPVAEATVSNLLALGVPGLVIAAIAGGLIVEPFRGRFLADAFTASIVFIVAATVALAVTRLMAIGNEAGFDWRRNPAWLGLVVVLLSVAIVSALPVSTIVGLGIQTFVAVAVGPLLIVGLAAGFDRAARRVILFFACVVAALYVFVALFGRTAKLLPPPPAGTGGASEPSPIQQVMTLSVGGLLLIVAIAAVVILVVVWMRRSRPAGADLVEETRTIDRRIGPDASRRRRRFARRVEPTDAVAAYRALLDDLDRHPDARREPAETPAAHAARLRAAGRAELSLDLLAADYALARFGGIELPPREDRRAVARWRDLRRRLIRPRSSEG
jgi:hypothetical protein